MNCLAALMKQTDGDFRPRRRQRLATARSRWSKGLPSVVLIETGEPRLRGGANRGIAATTTPWVPTLNNDTVVDSHWIKPSRRRAGEPAPRHDPVARRLSEGPRPHELDGRAPLLERERGRSDFNAEVRDRDAATGLLPDRGRRALSPRHARRDQARVGLLRSHVLRFGTSISGGDAASQAGRRTSSRRTGGARVPGEQKRRSRTSSRCMRIACA